MKRIKAVSRPFARFLNVKKELNNIEILKMDTGLLLCDRTIRLQ